jgi:hypothetical protein
MKVRGAFSVQCEGALTLHLHQETAVQAVWCGFCGACALAFMLRGVGFACTNAEQLGPALILDVFFNV